MCYFYFVGPLSEDGVIFQDTSLKIEVPEINVLLTLCLFDWIFKILSLQAVLCFAPPILHDLLILLGTLWWVLLTSMGSRLPPTLVSCPLTEPLPPASLLLPSSTMLLQKSNSVPMSEIKGYAHEQLSLSSGFTLAYLVRSPRPSHGSRNLYMEDLSICFELVKITFVRENKK